MQSERFRSVTLSKSDLDGLTIYETARSYWIRVLRCIEAEYLASSLFHHRRVTGAAGSRSSGEAFALSGCRPKTRAGSISSLL
jgi:hypothetical protein